MTAADIVNTLQSGTWVGITFYGGYAVSADGKRATAYIVADDTSIAGLGSTIDAAIADAKEWTSEGTEVHASRGEWQAAGQHGAYLAPCTTALAEQIKARGGCIEWGFVDDVACAVEEA